MSSLNSASSLADVKAAYADNAAYLEHQSPTEAAAFITACRLLLLQLPQRAVGNGQEIDLDLRQIQLQIDDANRFLTHANIARAPVHCYSLEHFRA
jgi:hypothetical protein